MEPFGFFRCEVSIFCSFGCHKQQFFWSHWLSQKESSCQKRHLAAYIVFMCHFAVDREHERSGQVLCKRMVAILINLFLNVNKSSDI